MIPWAPISPDTPVGSLIGVSCFADSESGRAMMLQVRTLTIHPGTALDSLRNLAAQVTVHAYRSFGWPRPNTKRHPEYLPISGACIAAGLVPRRIVFVPDAVWKITGKPYVLGPSGRVLFRDLVRHGPLASVRLQGALAMADQVKTTYGRMLADVAYRIEQSALFDSAVPTTRSFNNALAVWNDLDHEAASENDVVRLAGTLRLAFETARAHAETIGLDHLPATARADARRAAGAARLAVGAETDAERAAAQEQVVRILRSLALYYLPGPDRVPLQLTGG